MKTSFPKRLMAGALAGVIAMTSLGAAPAQAKDKAEIGRILLGAGALLVIGSAIANNRNQGHVTRKVHPPTIVHPPRRIVPMACLQRNKYAGGPRKFVTPYCLNKRMAHANRLPSGCLRSVWTTRGQRNVYSARCLKNSGWIFG